MSLSWHQTQGVRRAFRTRNDPAHILTPDTLKGMTALCGVVHPTVTVDAVHRNNPANKTCAKCCRVADKMQLPVSPVTTQ